MRVVNVKKGQKFERTYLANGTDFRDRNQTVRWKLKLGQAITIPIELRSVVRACLRRVVSRNLHLIS